jgi:hypothetical protein
MAQDEIRKTLTGGYDPSTSPYYQSVKAEAARNLADTNQNIASNAAGGGRYWSGARLGEQGKAATDTALGLNRVLGELSENERGRMMSVLPQAERMGAAEEGKDLQTADALQRYGGLGRENTNAMNQASYEEWLRATQQRPMEMAQLAAGIQQAPMYGENTKTPSTFMKMLGEVNPIAGSYNTAKYGYNTNQSSISDMAKILQSIMGGK